MTTEDQLQRIIPKLQLLVKKYESTKKENQQLKKKLLALETNVSQLHHNMDRMEQVVMAVQLSSSNTNAHEKKIIQQKLARYVKVIDQCIALLNK
jgi:cell division septum initiation protein DivIVA